MSCPPDDIPVMCTAPGTTEDTHTVRMHVQACMLIACRQSAVTRAHCKDLRERAQDYLHVLHSTVFRLVF